MESSPKGSPRRLDALLVERGLAASRSSAQGMILAGSVRVGDAVVTKAGSRIGADVPLSVEQAERFVSRAGEKLDAAIGEFGVPVEGRSCLDAGASTGGFTDALLQRGADRVLAVDVGYGQFDWTLRNDPRVTLLERTNVRRLAGEDLPFQPDLLVADLSFISLTVALKERLLDHSRAAGGDLARQAPVRGWARVGRTRGPGKGQGGTRRRDTRRRPVLRYPRLRCRRGDTGGRCRKEVGESRVPGAPAQGSGARPGRGAHQ